MFFSVITKSPSAGRHLSSLGSSSSSEEDSLSVRGNEENGGGDTQTMTATRNDRPWQPLIVIANRKSGGSDADAILSQFRWVGDNRCANGLKWSLGRCKMCHSRYGKYDKTGLFMSIAFCVVFYLRSILNPVQVIDLASLTPLDGLRWCLLFPDVQYRCFSHSGIL